MFRTINSKCIMTINELVSGTGKTAKKVASPVIKGATYVTAMAGPLLGAAPKADAALVDLSLFEDPTKIYLDAKVTNDDGVNYQALTQDLTPTLQSVADAAGTTLADVASNSTYDLLGAPNSSLGSGWNADLGTDGVGSLTNVGGIEGITYGAFDDGTFATLRLGIPKSYFASDEFLALGASNPDYVEAFSGIDSVFASGQDVKVAPEPATATLVGLGAAAAAGYRRRKN